MTTSARRTVLELAAAGVGAGMLAGFAEAVLGAEDPFLGTLTILPWVVAALRAVERHAAVRRVNSAERQARTVACVVLLLLTLGRWRLGLVATDWFLAAGFFLLLAHRTARILVGLRPSLGRHLPRRPPAAFFFLPLIVYLAIQPWSSSHRQPDGDEPFYLLVTDSLAYDFDTDLANNYRDETWRRFMKRPIEPQPGDPVGAAGEVYSRHSLLLPLVLAPAYRLAGRAGAMAVMAVLTAALAWMFLRLAGHYGAKNGSEQKSGAALLAYELFAFSPPLLLYSAQIWVEVPAALLLAVAFDRLFVLRHRFSLLSLAGLVLALASMPILKLRFALIAGPLLVLTWWRLRTQRAALGWALGSLGGLGLLFAVSNLSRFGNPLRIHGWGDLDVLKVAPGNYVRGFLGMFYDGAFGLFACAPVWLLLLPALGFLAKRRSPLLADLAWVSLPYLFFIVPRIEWFGGWAPAFRYPLVFLPLLGLTLVPILDRRHQPSLRALLAALAALTVVLTLVWVVIPGWTVQFADGRTHLLDQASVRLGADMARFIPSTVRPRAATWWWLAASALLIPWGYRLGRHPARGGIAGFGATRGVVVLLLLLPAWVTASRTLPTRIVHFEDDFVSKQRGSVYPPLWVLQRPRYSSGWKLPGTAELSAPVVTGGQRVTLSIFGRRYYEERMDGFLWVGAGTTHLTTVVIPPRWGEVTLGPVDWPKGESLILRTEAGSGPVILDRVEMDWQ